MSSTFAAATIETKPGKPRLDIKPGTNGNVPTEFNFQYKLYNNIAFMGQNNVGYAIGDNVDRTKPQTIFAACDYLRHYLRENLRRIARDPIDRNGVVLSIAPSEVKSQTVEVLVAAPSGTFIEESDLDQDKINLCFYILPESDPGPLLTGPGPYDSAFKRLTELAREFAYFTVGEPRRGATTVDDQVAVAGSATFNVPSYNDGPDGVGGSVTRALWLENGVVMRPFRAGIQPLVLTGLTEADDGNVYQVRADAALELGETGDAYRHSNIGTLTVSP